MTAHFVCEGNCFICGRVMWLEQKRVWRQTTAVKFEWKGKIAWHCKSIAILPVSVAGLCDCGTSNLRHGASQFPLFCQHFSILPEPVSSSTPLYQRRHIRRFCSSHVTLLHLTVIESFATALFRIGKHAALPYDTSATSKDSSSSFLPHWMLLKFCQVSYNAYGLTCCV